jgi:hypothetical protein
LPYSTAHESRVDGSVARTRPGSGSAPVPETRARTA